MSRSRHGPTANLRELPALLELSQMLGSARGFRAALDGALAILRESYGGSVVTAALVDEATGELKLEASAGLPPGRRPPVKLRQGEGVTGRVVASGKAVVVPQVTREPLLRTPHEVLPVSAAARHELSFVSVPLALDGRTVGALGLALPYDPARKEPQAQARAEGPLRPEEHRRPQRADEGALRAGRTGRATRYDRPHPRRVGNRQGARRARSPLQLIPRGQAVRGGELRGASREPDRVRALRLRAGRFQGRADPEERALRARRQGDALFGRGGRS